MRFAVVNSSTLVSNSDLDIICQAVSWSLRVPFCRDWNRSPGGVIVQRADALSRVPRSAVVVALLDDSDAAGALGYHDVTPDGRPYVRIFARPSLDGGLTPFEGIGPTLDHECKEAESDPGANQWADAGDGTEHAFEMCDACEEVTVPIRVGRKIVLVSDHLLPAYFVPGSSGKLDWQGKIAAPFTRTPGGYSIVRQASGEVTSQWGKRAPRPIRIEGEIPEAKLSAKSYPSSRTWKRGWRPAPVQQAEAPVSVETPAALAQPDTLPAPMAVSDRDVSAMTIEELDEERTAIERGYPTGASSAGSAEEWVAVFKRYEAIIAAVGTRKR